MVEQQQDEPRPLESYGYKAEPWLLDKEVIARAEEEHSKCEARWLRRGLKNPRLHKKTISHPIDAHLPPDLKYRRKHFR